MTAGTHRRHAAPAARPLPPDFDAAGFVNQAKLQFRKLQAAYDLGDRAALADVMTAEMLAEIGRDFDARGGHVASEVVSVEGQVLEVTTEADKHWASVRLYGLIREDGSRAAGALRRSLAPVQAGQRAQRMAAVGHPAARTGLTGDAEGLGEAMRHPVGALANRALERETWARERLVPHAGRRVTLAVGPVVVPFAIDASGLIDPDPAPGAPDLALSVSPLVLPAFLAAPGALGRVRHGRGRRRAGDDVQGSRADAAVVRRAGIREPARSRRRAARRRRRPAPPRVSRICVRAPRRQRRELRARRGRAARARRRGAGVRRGSGRVCPGAPTRWPSVWRPSKRGSRVWRRCAERVGSSRPPASGTPLRPRHSSSPAAPRDRARSCPLATAGQTG